MQPPTNTLIGLAPLLIMLSIILLYISAACWHSLLEKTVHVYTTVRGTRCGESAAPPRMVEGIIPEMEINGSIY